MFHQLLAFGAKLLHLGPDKLAFAPLDRLLRSDGFGLFHQLLAFGAELLHLGPGKFAFALDAVGHAGAGPRAGESGPGGLFGKQTAPHTNGCLPSFIRAHIIS